MNELIKVLAQLTETDMVKVLDYCNELLRYHNRSLTLEGIIDSFTETGLTENEICKNCGERLLSLRLQYNVSINVLTDELLINYRTYKKWEMGEVTPKVSDYLMIIAYYQDLQRKIERRNYTGSAR